MVNYKSKIVVGISGGVDSAVAALLLKQQGHEVIGVFMQNWDADRNDPHCTAEQDLSDARAVCDQIGIPLKTVNFARQYWDRVFQYCLDEFAKGRTPNPDIWCNSEIKFNVFLDHALSLGAERLATGHYARVENNNNAYQLCKGIDEKKDQTYFLHALNQKQLAHSLFPLGELHKSQVRELAQQHRLVNADKKDSTGVCFIGEREFKSFLQEFLLAQPGDIETTEGKKIGKHDGVIFYTFGQRKGLNISECQSDNEKPWYVVGKDVKNNKLIVGQGHNHPLLLSQEVLCETPHWIDEKARTASFTCQAKTRHRQPDQLCEVTPLPDQTLKVNFELAQRGMTPGQSIVFYDNNICLGGAIIQ